MDAYEYLIKLLSIKDYARSTLQRKLLEKKYSLQDIEESLAKAQKRGEFCEQRYQHSRIRGLLRKGNGPLLIQKKLEAEEISCDLGEIQAQAQEIGLSESILIEKWLGKRRAPCDAKERERLVRALLQKGFQASTIYQHL